jgi:hypothetical protein
MLDIAVDYIQKADGDRTAAAENFARDLMRGDPATFKAGYTTDNALLATADAFGIDDAEFAAVAARFANAGDQAACAELDRRGVQPPELDIDEEPIASVVADDVFATQLVAFEQSLQDRAASLEAMIERWNDDRSGAEPGQYEELTARIRFAQRAIAALALGGGDLLALVETLTDDLEPVDVAGMATAVAINYIGAEIMGVEADGGRATLAFNGGRRIEFDWATATVTVPQGARV